MAWRIKWRHQQRRRSFCLFRNRVVLWGDEEGRVFLEAPADGWEWATLMESPQAEPVVQWHHPPEGVKLHRDGQVVFGPDADDREWSIQPGDELRFETGEAVVEIASASSMAGSEVTYVERGEPSPQPGETTLRKMWELHRELAGDDEGWQKLLAALKRAAADQLGMDFIEGAGVLIWEGENEFYHRVVWEDTEGTEESAPESGQSGALASLLARDRELQNALRGRREVVIRKHREESTDVLLPIGEDEFLGAFYLLGGSEEPSNPEESRTLADLFEPFGMELIRRYHRNQKLRSIREENRYFRDRERRHYLLKDIVCESDEMRQVYDELNERVDENAPILLTGEAGTGKELLARALHHLGDRRESMLIRMGCADFPEDLVDFELFGCVASELTGAVAPRKGIFELAEGGTVFLDEVDRLSPMVQGKLIRVLKEREVRRIGDAVGRPVDARLVVSTHRDLEKLSRNGKFRRGLYEILKSHEMTVPPLRRRTEDILPLARIFLQKFAGRYGARCRTFDDDLREWMTSYSWPGNVRQLQSFLEAAVLMQRQSEELEYRELVVEQADGEPADVGS